MMTRVLSPSILLVALASTTHFTSVLMITEIAKAGFNNKWFAFESNFNSFNYTDSKALCESHGYSLAYMDETSDYTEVFSLFSGSLGSLFFQGYLGLVWSETDNVYVWDATGKVFDPTSQLPEGKTSISDEYCVNITCIGVCMRATMLQFNGNNKRFITCAFEWLAMKSVLCRNNEWNGYSQLSSSNCNITLEEAQNECLAKNQTLAYFSSQNDFDKVIQLFRPSIYQYAVYQFWIDMQYDYEYGFFRWVATGDRVYLPSGVFINDQWCNNTGDYRGVILKLEYPFNRYYLYCMPYDVPQCYGLCMAKNQINFTTNFYQYQLNGSWSEWGAWDSCNMMIGNETTRVREDFDCTFIALQNETNYMIDQRNAATQAELDAIAAATARELALLNEKYKAIDTAGETVSWLAFVILFVSYASVILLDVSKLFVKEKLDSEKEAEKKRKKKGKNKPKKRNRNGLRKASTAVVEESSFIKRLRKMYNDDEPRTSRSRGNSINSTGEKRPSLTEKISNHIDRRISFDTKMFNAIIKPLAKVRTSQPKRDENSLEIVNETNENRVIDKSNSKLTPMQPEQSSRKRSIENVINTIRRLSNVASSYMQPTESLVAETTSFDDANSNSTANFIEELSKVSVENDKDDNYKIRAKGTHEKSAKRYVKRVSYANTKLSKPDSFVVIDK